MANNKDFKVKNGIKPTVYHEGVGTVTSGSTIVFGSHTYSNNSLSTASQETVPQAIYVGDSGTKLYVVGTGNDTIYQYTMSTAYDLSTATYASKSFSVTTQEANPRGISFKTDGTKVYIAGSSNGTVYQYSLSTAWDISTASYDSVSFDMSTQTTVSVQGICFSYDGLRLYGTNTSTCYQYTLTTAWDVSTASYASKSLAAPSGDNIIDVSIDSASAYFYIMSNSLDIVYEYGLSTAGDLSTANSTGQQVSANSQEASVLGGFVTGDRSYVYVSGSITGSVYQYSGGNITTATLDLSTGSVFEITPTSDIQIGLSNPAASGTVSGATLLLGNTLLNAWDISTASRLNTLDVSGQDTDMEGIFLKPDGAKVYSVGYAGDTIEEYSMSTPYDLSTATYTQSFSVAGQETVPSDVFFKPDGTKMYVCGYTGDDVNEYALSTAWNISTASFTDTFSVSAQANQPDGIAFKPDGTKLYVMNGSNKTVYQYSVSTAWDVSTSSYDSVSFSVSSQDTTPRGVRFKPDGTKMYVVGTTNDSVYEYNLSTAWDVSTASYVQSFSTGVANPAGVDFSSDGSNMYITDAAGDDLIQYTVGTPATITYDSTLQWAGGTAPTSPAIGETDVLTFTTRDGGTTYNAVQSIDGAA